MENFGWKMHLGLSFLFIWNRGAQKELDLLEKKLQRTEAARAMETQHLSVELDAVRTKFSNLLKEKDIKINGLVEELGNTQALLSEKEAALSEVYP